MRLDKFLSNMGVDSRKGVRTFLKEGAVTVNGEVVKEQDRKIDTDVHVIKIYDEEIVYQRYIYLMMNKPAGVISATEDPRDEQQTVIDLLSEEYLYFEPFPVGRLDKDTVGLLLLTNDGIFAHRTLSPKKHVEKVYIATVQGVLNESDVAVFEKGMKLEDGSICKPAKLVIISAGDISQAEITITEGKFHQVKRMFEAVGKTVLTLKRTKFGEIVLDEALPEGEVRPLNDTEMALMQRYMAKEGQ